MPSIANEAIASAAVLNIPLMVSPIKAQYPYEEKKSRQTSASYEPKQTRGTAYLNVMLTQRFNVI